MGELIAEMQRLVDWLESANDKQIAIHGVIYEKHSVAFKIIDNGIDREFPLSDTFFMSIRNEAENHPNIRTVADLLNVLTFLNRKVLTTHLLDTL